MQEITANQLQVGRSYEYQRNQGIRYPIRIVTNTEDPNSNASRIRFENVNNPNAIFDVAVQNRDQLNPVHHFFGNIGVAAPSPFDLMTSAAAAGKRRRRKTMKRKTRSRKTKSRY